MPPGGSPDGSDPMAVNGFRWFGRRVRRHVHWARSQGLARLIEEDQLDPLERVPTALRKLAWRVTHDSSPRAIPVFVVGLQRSGTNMIVHGLERSPQLEVFNENDRAAFHRFRLRPDPVIRGLVERSRHPFVLFKPLCDSHRVGELLDHLGTPSRARAIWVFRSVDGRARSSVEKFGTANLRALRRIAEGGGDSLWQAQGLSEESMDLIRSFDYERLSPWSASALFWYVRNSILFEQGLARRSDFALASYDRVVADPPTSIEKLCRFLGVPFEDRYAAHVKVGGSSRKVRLEIDPGIRKRCDELAERLEEAVGQASWNAPV